MKKALKSVIGVLGLMCAVGCGSELPETASSQQESESALRAELARRVNAYAKAILSQDENAFRQVSSASVNERLDRVQSMRVSSLSLGSPLQAERESLLRVVGSEENFGDGFTVTAVEQVQPDVVAAQLSFKGKEVPKPFFFVKEGGQYKANVKPPQGMAGSVKGMANYGYGYGYYRVDNDYSEPRSIQCTGYGPIGSYKEPYSANLGPGGTAKIYCAERYCSGSALYDGAEFAPVQDVMLCAYQTFGADFKFSPYAPYYGFGCTQYC